jgi:hypothetical protein
MRSAAYSMPPETNLVAPTRGIFAPTHFSKAATGAPNPSLPIEAPEGVEPLDLAGSCSSTRLLADTVSNSGPKAQDTPNAVVFVHYADAIAAGMNG